jgi:hypothetical protein
MGSPRYFSERDSDAILTIVFKPSLTPDGQPGPNFFEDFDKLTLYPELIS